MLQNQITFKRIELEDPDARPEDFLFQDKTYEKEDSARLKAWQNDEWHFIGIRAEAEITIISPTGDCATYYTLESAGLWGIESDSDEAYLQSIYEDEKAQLIDAIKAFPLALENIKG